MATLKYKVIKEGMIDDKIIPINIVFVDKNDIEEAGVSDDDAIKAIGKQFDGPTGINIFDMDAITTTSDGLVVEGAIVKMGAADSGRVNPDFGILPMAEIEYSEEIIEAEPHLKQWKVLFPGKKLFRGPDPKNKIIPIHNVVISGRASNNNSATEMMNIITMDEIILPILGQLQCIGGEGEVLVGNTGEVISVGIGMTVAEKFGRVFPHPQFHAGETAHGSGEYAQTLKRNIPCIVCDKKIIAEYTIRAIEAGCIPARDIGCSPVVLSVARAMGAKIDFDRIKPNAQAELDSVGCTIEWMKQSQNMSKEDIISNADEIIPGVNFAKKHKVSDIVEIKEVEI